MGNGTLCSTSSGKGHQVYLATLRPVLSFLKFCRVYSLNNVFFHSRTNPSLVHRKFTSEAFLEPLHSLLSSSRPDDEISGELAELVGFDNIDLSMQLLANRHEAAQQISVYLQGTPQDPAPSLVNGRGKGKGKEGWHHDMTG